MRIKPGEDIRWSLRHVHFHRNSDTNDEERTVRFVETEETESRAVVKEVRTVKILSDGELAQKEFREAKSERRIIWREETSKNSCPTTKLSCREGRLSKCRHKEDQQRYHFFWKRLSCWIG